MTQWILVVALCLFFSQNSPARLNWTEGEKYSELGEDNPIGLSDSDIQHYKKKGLDHSLTYPVGITGILMPYKAVKSFVNGDSKNPIRKGIQEIFQAAFGFDSFDDLSAWLGLHKYPEKEGEGIYYVPFPGHRRPEYRMGVSLIEKQGVNGFTYSCATCHSANLFGKRILGMSNRFPHANNFFIRGKKALRNAPPAMFKMVTGTRGVEYELYKRSHERIKNVGAVEPSAPGLDTSLAHVAISLSHRNKDEYATFNKKLQRSPRSEKLTSFVADSKPAVWWNVKYKNKWLLDGSVVSGNPIFTNLLWNEIGRGTDLKELETWLSKNEEVIDELTTAVFSSEAPRYTEFYPAASIDLTQAQKGHKVYEKRCQKCHGEFVKNWDLPESAHWPLSKRLETAEFRYFEDTPIKDVNTDSQRREGMESLLQLNDLAISRKNGILIKKSEGYVPPPLIGIWARWPYLHNNSVPNLCALLEEPHRRPKQFWMGEAMNPKTDFDSQCVGYPVGNNVPKEWKNDKDMLFDTTKPGLSNKGHSHGIITKNGRALLTKEDKVHLIEFLKTL